MAYVMSSSNKAYLSQLSSAQISMSILSFKIDKATLWEILYATTISSTLVPDRPFMYSRWRNHSSNQVSDDACCLIRLISPLHTIIIYLKTSLTSLNPVLLQTSCAGISKFTTGASSVIRWLIRWRLPMLLPSFSLSPITRGGTTLKWKNHFFGTIISAALPSGTCNPSDWSIFWLQGTCSSWHVSSTICCITVLLYAKLDCSNSICAANTVFCSSATCNLSSKVFGFCTFSSREILSHHLSKT